VTNNNSTLSVLFSDQFPAPGTPFSGGGLSGDSQGIAIDFGGNLWATGTAANNVVEFDPDGNPISPGGTGFTGGGLNQPVGIAMDASRNAWVANAERGSNPDYSITEMNSAGAALSPGTTGFDHSTLNQPVYLALDRSGNVWVANKGANSVTEFIGPAKPVVTPLIGPAHAP